MNLMKNILLYGGLDKETYNKYKSLVLQQDMKNLRIYLTVTCVGFFMLTLVSSNIGRMFQFNTGLYLATAAAMLILLIAQRLLMHSHTDTADQQSLLIHLFMAAIYANGIVLTARHPDMVSVTYICAMLMLPQLFASRPAATIALQTISTIVFCLVAWIYETPVIAFTDTWNGITFYAVSIAAIVIVVPIRIKSLVQSQIIKEMSEHDFLTGLKNRTSFDADCRDYHRRQIRIVVIYADANGLHELNNTKGHAAGDAMLKTVASCIRETFGHEHSYRIGGDEFLVIYPDTGGAPAEQMIESLKEKVESFGYSVSFGYAMSESEKEDPEEVIKRAEDAMYVSKNAYYDAAGIERRKERNTK